VAAVVTAASIVVVIVCGLWQHVSDQAWSESVQAVSAQRTLVRS